MAFKIEWTEKAKQDRKEIFTYWNNRNKSTSYSKKLNLLFNNSIEHLQNFPLIGKASGYEDTRYLIVRDYLIFYKITITHIMILRIWGGRQNPDKIKSLSAG
jgi:addiction module RelE/StbE family toxin